MANLKNVIYLSNEDYETLASTGTVTIDGETLTYDENNVYITPDKLASTTEDGLMSATDKSKLDNIESGAQVNVQSDWNQTDTGADDYIKNKPEVDTDFSLTSTNALQNKVISEKLEYIDYALTHIKYKLFGVTTLSEIDYKVDYATIYPIPETLSDDDGTHRVVYSDTQLKEIEGNSVAFNQLVQNGNFVDASGWSSENIIRSVANNKMIGTCNGDNKPYVDIYRKIPMIKDHKYLLKATIKTSVSTRSVMFSLLDHGFAVCGYNEQNKDVLTKTTHSAIITCSKTDTNGFAFFKVFGTFNTGDTVEYENCQLFNLTQNGLDSVTTVEEAKSELLKRGINIDEYNEFNAGEIKNTIIKGVKILNSNGEVSSIISVPTTELPSTNSVHNTIKFVEGNIVDGEQRYNMVYVSKIDRVDLGTLTYTKQSSYTASAVGLQSLIKKPSAYNVKAEVLCPKYVTVAEGSITSSIKSIAISVGGVFLVNDSDYTDSTEQEIKTAMSGVILNYEKAEPTETTLATDLTFEEVSAIIEQGGSIEALFENVPPNIKTAFVVNKVIIS